MVKICSAAFHSLFTDELLIIKNVFKKYCYEIRIAGGAVRDLLMGLTPADVDFATTATPAEMMTMFQAENLRMLNKRGEKHGTVTCRVNDKENFEITTLRIDVLCDGRHADVQFTTDWLKDASRRDLTINSMFLGLDGTVYDYYHGILDVENRHVRFVGNAEDRIREDYLRILRYFRFYGRISKVAAAHDTQTLEAIRSNATGLKDLSGERIWMELKRIVVGNYADKLMALMLELDIGKHIGLGMRKDSTEFETVWSSAKDLSPEPMTMVSSLLGHEEEVFNSDEAGSGQACPLYITALRNRLKISNAEANLAKFIVKHRSDFLNDASKSCDSNTERKLAQDLLLRSNWTKVPDAKGCVLELMKYVGKPELLDHLRTWSLPSFPLNGHLLMTNVPAISKGPQMKPILNGLFQLWLDSDYRLTEEDLYVKAKELAAKLET